MEPVESVSEPLRHLDGRPVIWKMPGELKCFLEKAVPRTHELELFVSQWHTDPVLHADEPATALLARLRAEREAATARPKAKQAGKRPAKLT